MDSGKYKVWMVDTATHKPLLVVSRHNDRKEAIRAAEKICEDEGADPVHIKCQRNVICLDGEDEEEAVLVYDKGVRIGALIQGIRIIPGKKH